LIGDDEIITKPLDSSFLHGMTRDSVLKLAGDIGYRVDEREFTVSELLELVKTHEAALSGTAACLSPVGSLVYRGEHHKVMDGNAGPNTEKLRKALQDIQYGQAPDTHNWLTEIG
jgi:branched-chain amino acid aminotransferase